MKFGVQAGYLSSEIHVGRINKAGDAFLPGKEEATDMVLAAVAQYTMRNFDGGIAVDFPHLGLAMVVNVTPTHQPPELRVVSGNDEVDDLEDDDPRSEERPLACLICQRSDCQGGCI